MKLTATHGIIAMKGSGKTYRAMALAESMLDAGGQIVAIDPTGAWWGLRLSADGKRVAYPHLLVLGAGGSLPLSDSMGEAVARLVVTQRLSVVLDLSAMPKAGMRRFVTAFLLELYRTNPGRPLHTFVDEADLFAPEGAKGDASHCVGAMSDYFRRGRRKGLGGTLITQRVQAIAKDVLWQCEAMTILRLKGTHDIAAIKDWLDSNGYAAKEIAAALPKLNKGDRYLCDDEAAVMRPRGTDPRRTFDSSRTPEPGDDPFTPPALDDKALTAIKDQLGEAVAELEANDPAKLKAEVAKLKRELQAKPAPAKVTAETVTVTVEVPVLDDDDRRLLRTINEALADTRNELANARLQIDEIAKRTDEVAASINKKLAAAPREQSRGGKPDAQARAYVKTTGRATTVRGVATESERLGVPAPADFPTGKRGEMLTMMARIGKPVSRTRLAVLVGYHVNAKGFVNNVGSLRGEGLLTDGWPVALTEAGRQLTRHVPANLSADEVIDFWRGKLDPKERSMFDLILQREYGREELADACGYHVNAKSFANQVGRLRGLGLITKGWPVSVSEELQ